MMQGQVFLKGGSWHFSYLIFSRLIVLNLDIYLQSRQQLQDSANISRIQQLTSADINSQRLSRPAAVYNFLYMSKRTCGQVLVFPSQRLVHTAANDDFVKLLYSLQSCVMRLKENHFFLPISF